MIIIKTAITGEHASKAIFLVIVSTFYFQHFEKRTFDPYTANIAKNIPARDKFLKVREIICFPSYGSRLQIDGL